MTTNTVTCLSLTAKYGLWMVPSVALLAGCPTMANKETDYQPVQLEQLQFELKRQIGIYLKRQSDDALKIEQHQTGEKPEVTDAKYECGTGDNVFILTSVTMDLLVTKDMKVSAGGTGNAAGGWITIPKPTGSKEESAAQHLIYKQAVIPEGSQNKEVISDKNYAILTDYGKHPAPIADTIENLKNGLLDASKKLEVRDLKNSQPGRLPCLTAAPVGGKTPDQSYTLNVTTTKEAGVAITLVVVDYGPTIDHKNISNQSIIVTFQEWPWKLLPSPQSGLGGPIDSNTTFVYCQAEHHQVGICKVGKDKKTHVAIPSEIPGLKDIVKPLSIGKDWFN